MGVQSPAVIFGPNGGRLLKGDTIDNRSGNEIFPNKANRNYLYNPEFRFIQRLDDDTNFSVDVDDDQYCFDQWICLTSDAGTPAVEARRIEGVVTGENNRFHAKFTQLDAVAARFGTIQFLPLDDIQHLRGKELTFSFAHKTTSTEIVKLRAGIVEWTGTADAVTSDVVDTWAATPTLVASTAFLNTPAEITVSSAWATEDITATVGASATNLAVFVWTPDAEAQNDEFFLGNTQLVVGDKRVPWASAAKPYTQDLAECQKFVQKSMNLDTKLLSTGSPGAIEFRASSTNHIHNVRLKTMFGIPTVVIHNTVGPTTGSWRDFTAGTNLVATTSGEGPEGFNVGLASSVDGNDTFGHWLAIVEL